jgi:chromosome segregation protein
VPELLAGLRIELDRYAKLADLEGHVSRLTAEFKDREQQLVSVIGEIKDKQAQLRQMDDSVRREIERQHEDRRKQLETESLVQAEKLNTIKNDIRQAEQQLLDIQNQTEDTRRVNTELLESTAEESAIYEELAGKVNSQKDLYSDYQSLIENEKTIRDELEADIHNLGVKRSATIAAIDRDIVAAQAKAEDKKRGLLSEINELEASRESCRVEIAQAKRDDADRLRDLEDREETVLIKADALRREREEFETSKRRHTAATTFNP